MNNSENDTINDLVELPNSSDVICAGKTPTQDHKQNEKNSLENGVHVNHNNDFDLGILRERLSKVDPDESGIKEDEKSNKRKFDSILDE